MWLSGDTGFLIHQSMSEFSTFPKVHTYLCYQTQCQNSPHSPRFIPTYVTKNNVRILHIPQGSYLLMLPNSMSEFSTFPKVHTYLCYQTQCRNSPHSPRFIPTYVTKLNIRILHIPQGSYLLMLPNSMSEFSTFPMVHTYLCYQTQC